MAGINGYRFRSPTSLIIVFIDGLLILSGVLIGTYIRLWGSATYFLEAKYITLKLMLPVLVIQMAFYYFDLYDLNNLRERKTMAILLLGSLGVSSIFLALIYYLIPSFVIGRGIFAISLSLIFLFTFVWRLLYVRLSKVRAFKEKILIIGTGELAKRIKKEILENGNDGFEIIGFVDETREKVGKKI
jgi:FlaA1/EpsC-like NDP-sugar epimerase